MATYDRFVSELGSTAPQGTGTPWMRALSEHYLETRDRFPDGDLCIVFDIDGTIVDMRHHIAHVLLGYDRLHGTQHFQGLVAPEIVHHEDDVAGLLSSFGVPIGERVGDREAHYRRRLWDDEAMRAATRPFEGVLGVIRWFQLHMRISGSQASPRSERLAKSILDEALQAHTHSQNDAVVQPRVMRGSSLNGTLTI